MHDFFLFLKTICPSDSSDRWNLLQALARNQPRQADAPGRAENTKGERCRECCDVSSGGQADREAVISYRVDAPGQRSGRGRRGTGSIDQSLDETGFAAG